jgi:hypothetical protein
MPKRKQSGLYPRIRFDDGTMISVKEAARLIEGEGQLCRLSLGQFGMRCGLAVLQGTAGNEPDAGFTSHRVMLNPSRIYKLTRINDDFHGTPEARAAHVAAALRRGEV